MKSIYASLKIYGSSNKIGFAPDRGLYLIEQIRNRSTLHVGCTDSPITADRLADQTLLHLRLRKAAKMILGIDISEEGLALLQSHGCDDVAFMDAEHLDMPDRYERILAGDVLEHMNNPGLFIQGAREHLVPGGELIIGVPNALSAAHVKTWLGGREEVHMDHTFYFSPKTLAELCRRHDLLPTSLVFTTQPALSTESGLFIGIRTLLTKLQPALSPSLIMHFKASDEVDRSHFVVWN